MWKRFTAWRVVVFLSVTFVSIPLVVYAFGVPESTEVPQWLVPATKGPDGRYQNTVGELSHGKLKTRLPFFWRRVKVTVSPRSGASVPVNGGSEYFASGSQDGPTVTWVGHATVLVEMDGVRFLTDPMWSKRASPLAWLGPARRVEPGIAFEDLPAIDFVLISHNHFDHLDLPTLKRLAERDPETRFVVPLGNAKLLRDRGISQVIELDWMEHVDLGGVEIHCLPSQHWSKRSLNDTNKALWSSWAVIGDERRFYFAGDTGYFGGFAEIGETLGPFDLAAVPIGAYEPTEMMFPSHMDPEQAFQAAVDLQARTALGIHFGTFDLADEPLDEPPKRFRDEAERRALDASRDALPDAWIFSIGEIRDF